MRRAILSTRPDVVISSLQHVKCFDTARPRRHTLPVVVSEHIDPIMISCERPWDELRRVIYRRAAKLVSVSHGIDQHFAWLPQSRRIVIYNPLPIIDQPNESADVPTILNDGANWLMTMGRLSRQKGPDCFSRRSPESPEKIQAGDYA